MLTTTCIQIRTTQNTRTMSRMRFVLYTVSLFLLPAVLSAPFNSAGDSSSSQQRVTAFPSRTDHQGRHASFNLLSKVHAGIDDRHYFRVEAFGRRYILNVSETAPFISSDHVLEYHGDEGVKSVETSLWDNARCHLTGTAHEEGHLMEEGGWVAISNCRGLRGVIETSAGTLFIEPVGATPEDPHTLPHQHLVYTHPPELRGNGAWTYDNTMSSVLSHSSSRDSDRVRRSPSSSTSSEHYVEVAVVADHTMLEYHGTRELEAYLFTLMNMVAHLYRDPSIGHAMNIVVVRTVILETEQSGLSVSSNALHSLNSFCAWQSSSLLTSSGQDLTVLVTRTNLCEEFGGTCGTLGIAEFKGACTSGKGCSISEDIGLATAFTIAHEIGHNLGIHHDGDMAVMCEPDNHYIMAPSFVQSHNPHRWSHCSRQQLSEFLLSPESWCLSNQPEMEENFTRPNSSLFPSSSSSAAVPLPGLETTPTEQCRLMLGDEASHCGTNTTSDFCSRLWCRENDQSDCDHRHIPPAPGTECTLTSGKGGVCYQGACVEFQSLVDPVEGGWGEWGEWEECSLTCGTGVQRSSRPCDSPVPANGGRYCLGASQRYQTCNTHTCPGPSDIRGEMCVSEPPHSRYTEWQAPSLEYISSRGLDQCSHHCLAKPNDILFTLTMGLPDGTPCLFTSLPSPSHPLYLSSIPESLGVCVRGECVPVGCDSTLNHMATRDACGVWCGNGSTCVSVSDTYTIPDNNSRNGDYFYHKVATIPQGSGGVKISELSSMAHLYLAAMTSTEHFNGNYRVKEGGLSSYWFAGGKWWYERPEGGIECLRTEGLLVDDVDVFMIANTQNVSISISAGVPSSNATMFTHNHVWRTGEWSVCSSDCGEGVRRRSVECVRLDSDTVVEDSHCTDTEPHNEEVCYSNVGCRYEWRVSPWDNCSTTCGIGERSRLVECLLTNRDEVVNASHCDSDTLPSTRMQCYSEIGCVFDRHVGEWGNCSSTCGAGERERDVVCVLTNNNTVAAVDRCDQANRPEGTANCYTESGCVFEWQTLEWGECSSSCGGGYREREVVCILTNNETVVSTSHCTDTPPSTTSHCYSEEGCVFEWQTLEWGECSSSCGGGYREREVVCVLTNNETVVSTSHCTDTPPSTTSHCYSEEGCVFEWQTLEWGECSSSCGGGYREREVVCVLTNNETVVSTSHCTDTPPSTTSHCYSEEGCVFEWQTLEWGGCSSSCGGGYQEREVVCVLTNNETIVSASHCMDTPPSTTSHCYSEEGCMFEWWHGTWTSCSTECGQGIRSRDVACYLTNNNTQVSNNHCPSNTAPASTTPCYTESGCVFVWGSELWTGCSASCGTGHVTRGVSCVLKNNGSTVADVHCSDDTRPATRRSCYSETGCVFELQVFPWSECSSVCGTGHVTRGVSCILTNNGTTVADVHCSDDTRPATRRSCYSETGCVFELQVSPWSECSSVCGTGHVTRGVSCVLTNNGTTVADVHCSDDTRPATRRSCYSETGCVFEWQVFPWSECSSVCGTGHVTRGVSCVLTNNGTTVADVHCSDDTRPATRRSCYSETGCVFEWHVSPWSECSSVCGGGEHRREVTCVLTDNGTTVDGSYCDDSSGSEPDSVGSCGTEECRFAWREGDWGECVGDSCEEGRRWRDVECVLVNNQSVVEDGHCNESGRPDDSSSCQAEVCRYQWVVSEWGVCSMGCGEGVRERGVCCELVNGREGRRVVEVERCDGLAVPPEREACFVELCSNFQWTEGEWTQCNAKCDETGSQTRTVTCQHENGTVVPDSPYCTTENPKPNTDKSCRGDPCPDLCVDNPTTSCRVLVRLRLCHIDIIHNLCCHSCSVG